MKIDKPHKKRCQFDIHGRLLDANGKFLLCIKYDSWEDPYIHVDPHLAEFIERSYRPRTK